MSTIKSLSPEERKSHFHNVAVLAIKDGSIQPQERRLLECIARDWDVSDAEIKEVEEHPDSIPFVVPKDRNLCFQQLYDLVEMMIIDGEMKQTEKQLCEALAERLGFKPEAIRTIINGILEGNKTLRKTEDIQRALRTELL
ncbi:MAG: TerB family tellurite resistance protein [Spartobacteria bacterium]|nr:TerB family tellurite resistance protein [Spartobacteria bacterium]